MGSKNYTRDEFLKAVTRGTLAAISTIPLIPDATPFFSNLGDPPNSGIPDDAIIVFQGDSITDAGRNKSDVASNSAAALGSGYAFLSSSNVLYHMPEKRIRCFNRGISGNKVFQLSERWKTDCLELKPDILSILVGVNDFWHTLDFDYKGNATVYENDYRTLLKRTLKSLPDVRLIIGEPFALKEGSAINDQWFPDFLKYQAAARRIARDFDAAFIPYQAIFDEAAQNTPAAYWSVDGVHPTLAGSQLMATAWLETFRRL